MNIPAKLHRFISFCLSFVLLFQTFAPAVLAVDELITPEPTVAQEQVTPTPEPTVAPTEEPTPTETVTPAPEITPTPTEEEITSTPSPTPDATLTPELTPTPTVEVTVTPDATPSPEPTLEPTQAITETSPPAESSNPPTDTPEISPTPTPSPTPSILEPAATTIEEPAVSVAINSYFASLFTDKLDYFPTDTVNITGTNLPPFQTLSITISSTDDPAISFSDFVFTDGVGSFTYAYTLDGNYRPNYSVEVRDESGTILASSTFTDHNSQDDNVTICHKNDGNGWNELTVDDSSVDGNGSGDHNKGSHQDGEDIIPPTYGDGRLGSWNSRNWDAEGQAIWNNNCDDRGSIKIIKDSQPNDDQDFSFSYNPPGNNNTTSFILDDNGNNSGTKDNKTFSDLNTGTYEITESSTSGWTLADITCNTQESISLNNRKVTINLGVAENVICTFTNTKQSQTGMIIVHKDVQGPNGEDVTDNSNYFEVRLDAGTGQAISDNITVTYNDVPVGSHTITESLIDSDYTLYGISSIAGTSGNTSGLTFNVTTGTNHVYVTNRQKTGKITVVKDVVNPDGDPISDSHPFTVNLSPGSQSSPLAEGSNAVFTVNPGTYTVSESEDGDYTNLGCLTVTGKPDPFPVASGAEITITCTNQQKKATITVIKDVVKSDLTPIEDNHTFQVTVDGTQKPFGEGASAVFEVNPGGPYGATEASDANYVLVSQDGSVTVGSNGNATINIVNRQNTASISGYKYLTGTETGLSLWTINLFEGDAQIGTDTTDENGFYSFNDLFPGNYSLEEILNPGWEQTGSPDPIELNGENIIGQNFYNRGALSITACKYEDSNGPLEGGEYAKVDNWNFSLGDINQSTEEGNCATFENLTPGEYTVTEGSQEGWYSADEQTSQEVELGAEDVTVNFYNYQRGSIFGYKWSDANGNREYDCNSQEDSDEEGTCEEKLPGWTIFIDENGNGELDNGEEEEIAEVSTTTGVGGSYSFEGLEPGTYSICEVQQRGWDQTYPNGEGGQCHQVTVTSGQDSEANFGNHYTPPQLHLDKSNNSTSDETPGSSVTYTITLNVSDNFVDNAIVRDLLPKGFKYRLGSWQAKLNGFTYSITEPEYHSPGDWQLGNLLAGDIVELTYIADIDPTQTPGLYKDIAWAKGDEPVGGGTVLAIADDTTNFVGTQVNVIKDTQDTPTREVEQKVEGQVLGASTTLPATGADTRWLYLALILGLLGTTATSAGIILKRKHE